MSAPRTWVVPEDGRKLFVRYANRRYYEFGGQHVTSWSLLEHRRGEIRVIDHVTGKDITDWARASAKAEEERKRLRLWADRIGIAGGKA